MRSQIAPGETVLVLLDSNHTKAHVLAELEAYGPLVTKGSYIVATDGIIETGCRSTAVEPRLGLEQSARCRGGVRGQAP